jgi:hypothetical protein
VHATLSTDRYLDEVGIERRRGQVLQERLLEYPTKAGTLSGMQIGKVTHRRSVVPQPMLNLSQLAS